MRLAEQLRTTTFLLTLRYMVLFFVSVTVLMAVTNWAIRGYLQSREDDTVRTVLRTFNLALQNGGIEELRSMVSVRAAAGNAGDAFYLLADPSYKPIAGNLPRWPRLEPLEDGWVRFRFQHNGQATTARGQVLALGKNGWLLVAREEGALGGLSKVLDRAFALILGSTLVLAFIGGLAMSNNVLQRVNTINMTARQIMEGDLSHRMPTRGTRDEFDQLSLNLNQMLDQIESLLESIRHISDNIAHDLRTPLTRLRGRLETLRYRAGEEDARQIDACLQDADGLLATFASLLSIARIESGASDSQFHKVDLAQITQDACELYQALAEDKNIELQCDIQGPAIIKADRNLVFQALTNLLDNAIKYTGPGGQIHAQVFSEDGQYALIVSDTGPGIPAEKRERVLQR
ncbi:MAG TPA: HAMP domain-containing histidine kinase, partial [Chromatiales bacterium]|nr:HAMP domain-containing histidine kinase [Chromatiales bacterium]